MNINLIKAKISEIQIRLVVQNEKMKSRQYTTNLQAKAGKFGFCGKINVQNANITKRN